MNALQTWGINENITQSTMAARISEAAGVPVTRSQYGGWESGRNAPLLHAQAVASAIEKLTGGAVTAQTILSHGLREKRVAARIKGDTGKHLHGPRKPAAPRSISPSPEEHPKITLAITQSAAVLLFKNAVYALHSAGKFAEAASLPDLAKTARALVELAGEGGT